MISLDTTIYRNQELRQFSFIFLHRPFSRSFNSRPPWDPWKFGDDEWSEQVDAAATTDMAVAIEDYLQRRKESIEANYNTTSFLHAVLSKIYIVSRVHVDSQVGTLYQKHCVSEGDKNIKVAMLGQETGLGVIYRNKHERTNGRVKNYFIGDDLENAIFASKWNGENVTTAMKNVVDKIITHDLNNKRRGHFQSLQILVRVKEENFLPNSQLFEQVLGYLHQEHDTWLHSRATQRKDDLFDMHYNELMKYARHLSNWHKDAAGEYVLLLRHSKKTSALHAYLWRLKDGQGDGDDERRGKLEAIGWSFDMIQQKEASLSRLVNDFSDNVEKTENMDDQHDDQTAEEAMKETFNASWGKSVTASDFLRGRKN